MAIYYAAASDFIRMCLRIFCIIIAMQHLSRLKSNSPANYRRIESDDLGIIAGDMGVPAVCFGIPRYTGVFFYEPVDDATLNPEMSIREIRSHVPEGTKIGYIPPEPVRQVLVNGETVYRNLEVFNDTPDICYIGRGKVAIEFRDDVNPKAIERTIQKLVSFEVGFEEIK
jgi:hypothetical protein